MAKTEMQPQRQSGVESQGEAPNQKTAKWLNQAFLPTTQLPEESLAETTLSGRYLIKQELGRGGFGAVYLALDKKMVSRPVVVKVLLDCSFADGWSVRRFNQEIEALARLDHPSIVGIFDAGETPEGRPYLVMQYVDGVSLRSAIKPEGMDFVRAANIIRQIGRALGAAHRRGILHRDLKPENIMLRPTSDGDEQVKVIDFGVAKVRDSETSLSSGMERAVGTIAYMSPEQLSALNLTAASDIYSFAVMAYEMLTGRRPLNPESVYQLLEMQRAGVKIMPVDLRPNLPLAAQDVLLQALSFDAADRHQNVRDFGDQLAWALISDRDINEYDEVTKPHRHVANQIESEVTWARGPEGLDQSRIPTVQVLKGKESPQTNQPRQKEEQITDFDQKSKTARQILPSFVFKHSSFIRISLLGLILVAGGILFTINYASKPLTSTQPSTSSVAPALSGPPAGKEQSFSYWLTVQKMIGNKPLGSPIQTSGDLVFGNGWKFRFNLKPGQAGAVYLLNVGPAKDGGDEYNVLFPNPRDNGGDARLAAEQVMEGGWYDFVGQTGVEKMWIIWSDSSLPDLDSIFSVAARNRSNPGVITNAGDLAVVQSYLKKYYAVPPEVINDKEKKLTLVKSRGSVIVTLVELSHEAY